MITIAATDPDASEVGANTGTFTITRVGNTQFALTVFFTRTGTATAGSDFGGISSSVSIPGTQTSATVSIVCVLPASLHELT